MKVDVLAVMDRAADQLGQAGHNETANALLTAREAAAEIIWAAERAEKCLNTPGQPGMVLAGQELNEALATLSREGR